MSNEFPTIKPSRVDELIPYARNSRTHSDEQVAQIAASIREFGFLNPVIVDGEHGIIAGHGRVLAARKLGLDEVPTVEASHLTDAQKRAYIIADNKLALNAGCDESWSIKDLAKMIGLMPDMKPGMKGNRMSAPLATKKTKSLGWQWRTSLPYYIQSRIDRGFE